MSKSRNFTFTYNLSENIPTIEDAEENLLGLNTKYLIYSVEMGKDKEGIHLQGFMTFENPIRYRTINDACPGMWVETARSVKACIKYASKADTNVAGPFEHGTRPAQGYRSDIKVALDEIKEGKSVREVILAHPSTVLFSKHLSIYESMLGGRPKDFIPKVFIRYGPPGSGKTRWCYDNYETVFKLKYNKNEPWWDGYSNQKCILIDDWPLIADENIYNWLLDWCDRYPTKINVKGAMGDLGTGDIVITSNDPPITWFGGRGLRALERRVTMIEQVCSDRTTQHDM